jgi:uncharacterized membrane protein YccC
LVQRREAKPLPERFESNVFDRATAAMMKAALELALLKRKPSRADEAKTRTLLASAIIDQVNAGERVRQKIVDQALATLAASRNISRQISAL